MSTLTQEMPPALAGGTGAEKQLPQIVSLAGPMLEIRALGAILAYPAARERCRALGGALLWTDEAARAVAHEALSGQTAPVLSTEHLADEVRWLCDARDFMPTSEAWAVALVDRLAVEKWREWLPEVLRWSAERAQCGGSIEHTAREVGRAFARAGVDHAA